MTIQTLQARSLRESTTLSKWYLKHMIEPIQVIRVLNASKISFVLVGLHGLSAWMREPPRAPDQPLFPNARGGRLSAHGVHYVLAKHVEAAAKICPSLRTKRVSPHVLRHTTAMDLLQEGVEQRALALWLGHESIETTQIYIDANLEIKQAALDKVEPQAGRVGRFRPEDQLLAFLKAL